jgi:two-component system OmpR family response regulator
VTQHVPIRILCVDDNRDVAESLALVLQMVGFEAATAFDGPSALEAARRFRPDACITDINMPGMDGYELAGRLREWAGNRPLLLIAVTARTTDEARRRPEAAGFDLHLNKPADPVEVLGRVVSFGTRLASADAAVRAGKGTLAGGQQRA